MINNVAIEVLDREHGKRVKKFFEFHGIYNNYFYSNTKEDGYNVRFYAVIDGESNVFTQDQIPTCVNIITLPRYEEYSKQKYPKEMLVSNQGGPRRKRVVFMEKCGKYLAWSYCETLQESERETNAVTWDCAEEIPQANSQKQNLMLKAEELIKKANELKETANKL